MAKVGILVFTDLVKTRAKRKATHFDSLKYLGIKAVMKEIDLKKHTVTFISASDLNDYDYVLVPIHSFQDILNLVKAVSPYKKKRKAKIIVGGQGVVNVKAYLPYIDIAVFGRAEGQINEILGGGSPENVLVVKKDPNLEKGYFYRQPQYLVDGEKNVGCRNKCYFCFYSWTHKLFCPASNYNSTVYDECSTEDDIKSLKVTRSGHYLTAVDGFSEESRLRVNKQITNSDLKNKIKEILKVKSEKKIFIKTFIIAGYPWEKIGEDYIDELKGVIERADGPTASAGLSLYFQVTPFSPTPLTPMQYCKPNFSVDFRRYFQDPKRIVFYRSESIVACFGIFIRPPSALFEEVFIHRASREDSWLIEKVFLDPKYIKLKDYQKMLWLKDRGFLEKYETGEKEEWGYLTAGHNLAKFKGKFN